MKRLLNLFRRSSDTQKERTFLDIMDEWIARYTKENQLTDQTAQKYTQRRTNIHIFLSSVKKPEILCSEVKPKLMEDLRSWLLINLKTCCRRHASRHIDLCKNVIRYALQCEYISVDYISPIKGERDKRKPIIHLTINELSRIHGHIFSGVTQAVVDRFLFQCYTGLSHCEVETFLIVNINGRDWIDSTRDKTGQSEYVWLFDEAKEIINKYGGKIPNIPNQTCNRVLKEVASILNIQKPLTTHVGRKTHATILDERGASLGTISRQLRNTEPVCNQDYIAKSHRRTENEMNRLGLTDRLINIHQILLNRPQTDFN